MAYLSKSRWNDDNVTTNGYDTNNIDDNTGDELALHCRRVHPAGDRHRHDMRGNLLQNCWGDFFPSFLAVWVWTLFLLFLPQVCFFAAAEPEFSLRGKSNLKSKRLKITSFEPKSRSVISRYDVAAVRKEAFHSRSFLIFIKSQAANFLARTEIVQFKSKTGIKGLAVNKQEDCPIRSKNWDQKSTFDTEEKCPFQSDDWNKKLSTIYTE